MFSVFSINIEQSPLLQMDTDTGIVCSHNSLAVVETDHSPITQHTGTTERPECRVDRRGEIKFGLTLGQADPRISHCFHSPMIYQHIRAIYKHTSRISVLIMTIFQLKPA